MMRWSMLMGPTVRRPRNVPLRRSPPDMSVKFHSRQKVPQRTTADTEFGCKFTLGWKFVTVGQRVLGYKGQQFIASRRIRIVVQIWSRGQVRIDRRSLPVLIRLL